MNCDTIFTVQCSFESQQQHTCDSVIESNIILLADLKVNGICTRLSLIDCNIDNGKAELLAENLVFILEH